MVGYLVLITAGTARNVLGAISKDRRSSADPSEGPNPQSSPGGAQTTPPVRNPNDLTDRIFKREKEQMETIENSAPIVDTYIQEEESNALMGTVPKKDLYFLGQGDFRGKTMKVHSMTGRTHTGSIIWSYEPAGFLQMAFLDLRDFDKEHYRLTPPSTGQRVFLGDVRCYVFDVERAAKAKGPRFRGRIWVEDQDFTIVRMNGTYAPESDFSLRHFENEFYEPFDSWRTNVRSGLWLPSNIYIQDLRERRTEVQGADASVGLWPYNAKPPGRIRSPACRNPRPGERRNRKA